MYHREPSIGHLVLAVSRLDRLGWRSSPEYTNDRFYLWHYSRALKLLGESINPDLTVLLAACLLLIVCDELQQNAIAAMQHVEAGRLIIAQKFPENGLRPPSIIADEIGPIFSEIEVQASEYFRNVTPVQYRIPLPLQDEFLQNVQHLSPHQRCSQFRTDHDAVATLQILATECVTLKLHGKPPRTRFESVESLTTRLNTWMSNLNLNHCDLDRYSPFRSITDIYILRTYYVCLHVMSRCAPFDGEMTFDLYTGVLDGILSYCMFLMPRAREEALDTLEKFIPPLWFVATRYRTTSMRREAIELLKSCGRDGEFLAAIALHVVEIEEHGLINPVVCSDVPEERRVRLLNLRIRPSLGSYTLTVQRYPFGDPTRMSQFSFQLSNLPWKHDSKTWQGVVSFEKGKGGHIRHD